MGNGRHIGRGALASARQIRHLGYAATRITVSMGAAVLVVTATVLLAPVSTVSPALELSADSTALILGRTSVPTPDDAYVEIVKNQYIGPTHPGQDINYVAVTTPQEFWPLSALLFRLPGLVLGPREIWGPGGPGWPDEPWWKLSGLFDLTVDRSLYAGVADLEQAMAQYGNDNLVIYGYQQGAAVANVEKRKLAEQYPVGTKAPDIDFVLGGDPNLPNGGFASRFPGLYIPILDLLYNGPAPTDTQFDTTVIVRQYDFEDFPLYPLNILADLNAILGAPYVNFNGFDVSLAPDPSASPAIQSKHGDTTYYFFPTADLPLFGPLRSLGVPEAVIDVVEPLFRALVELGYDRSIKLWEPTPARLIPRLDPVTVAGDLVDAIGEGVTNAQALIGAPPLQRLPAAPVTADRNGAVEQVFSEPTTAVNRVARDVADGVSRVLAAVGSPLPKQPVGTRDNLGASQRTVGRELAAARDRINQTIGAVKSVIGNRHTSVGFAGGDNGSAPATAHPARKTPVRDAVATAGSHIKKVVTKVSHSIKTALSGKDDDNTGDGGEGAAG